MGGLSISLRTLILFCLLFAWSCKSDDEGDGAPVGTLTSIEPGSGGIGRLISIKSDNAFSTTAGSNVVKFNGVIASNVSIVSAGEISALVPSVATTGVVTVETSGVVRSGPVFTVVPAKAFNYVIRFNQDGVYLEYEDTDLSQAGGCSSCVCYALPNSTDLNSVNLGACLKDGANGNAFNVSNVETLKTMEFPLEFSTEVPYAYLQISVDGEKYLNNGAGQVKITDVVYHSSESGHDWYDISGTFEGTLIDLLTESKTIVIQDGSFTVPLFVDPN